MNDKARTITGAIGGGLVAVLVIGMIAFGASTIRPLTAGHDSASASGQAEPAAKPADDGQGPKHETAYTGGDERDFPRDFPRESREPKAEPTAKPNPEATPVPKPEPTAKPEAPDPTAKPKAEEPKPVSDHLELDAWVKEGRVKLAWSKYAGDGFEYYKVVRSVDATVTWPTGADDALVAVVSDQWSPWAVDEAPCGTEFHYRVFAVRHAEEGYKVLAASNVAAAYRECAPEPADPVVLDFDVFQTDGGAVRLEWQECATESFKYYKVVRSAVNETPTYPLNDGDELLAAIGDQAQNSFTDTDVEPGQTWHYRVLCFSYDGLVGATVGTEITVE